MKSLRNISEILETVNSGLIRHFPREQYLHDVTTVSKLRNLPDWLFLGGSEATTGNTSAVRTLTRLSHGREHLRESNVLLDKFFS